MEVAAYQHVPPDWFQDKPSFWYEWARIRYQVNHEVEALRAKQPR